MESGIAMTRTSTCMGSWHLQVADWPVKPCGIWFIFIFIDFTESYVKRLPFLCGVMWTQLLGWWFEVFRINESYSYASCISQTILLFPSLWILSCVPSIFFLLLMDYLEVYCSILKIQKFFHWFPKSVIREHTWHGFDPSKFECYFMAPNTFHSFRLTKFLHFH